MGDYASAGQIKAGFMGDRCPPKALGRENHVCVWEGGGQVSADLQGWQEHRWPSHVVFKLLALSVCLSQHRKLQRAAAKSRLPGAGGQMAADTQSRPGAPERGTAGHPGLACSTPTPFTAEETGPGRAGGLSES